MSAKILDGKKIADGILEAVSTKRYILGLEAGLAILSIGNDPASDVYIKNKMSACKRCGFACHIVSLPYLAKEALDIVQNWNYDKSIHGIIVQLPVPKTEDDDDLDFGISLTKDVDGLYYGDSFFEPCTPRGIMRLLSEVYPDSSEMDGLNAVVIGRSEIVGKPIAQMLLGVNCTVTTCHSHTQNLAMHTKNADILIVAAGKPGLITADMVKPGAVVIDVGINRVNGKLVGDVDFEDVKEVAGWITPVPGGVGPMTVAMLMENTLRAAINLEGNEEYEWNNDEETDEENDEEEDE